MTRTLVALGLFAITAWPASVRSESIGSETPRFYLCESFVAEAVLGHSEREPEDWFVHVKLTPPGTSALAEFTRAHLGEVAQVLVGSSVVVEARIQTIVDSGRIQSSAQTRSLAEALSDLLSSPPSAPCGAQSPAAQQAAEADGRTGQRNRSTVLVRVPRGGSPMVSSMPAAA